MSIPIDDSKSYATVTNLQNALEKLGFASDRHVVVRTPRDARFTAIFPASNITNGDLTRYARHGFLTLG